MTYNVIYKLMHKVWDDRYAYATAQSLFAGEGLPSPKSFPPTLMDYPQADSLEHPMHPILDIDMDLIQGVVRSNGFGIHPWRLLHSERSQRERDYSEGTDPNLGRAVYAFPSLLNHSCIPSSHELFIGDAMVIRATRDIPKGGEVTNSYLHPRKPYDEKKYDLMQTWRFECTCALCEEDHKDGERARMERASILENIKKTSSDSQEQDDAGSLSRMAVRAKKHCDDMKRTYKSDRAGRAFWVQT